MGIREAGFKRYPQQFNKMTAWEDTHSKEMGEREQDIDPK
jgi:hypothetical protein